jgi:hypothetical protein
MVIIFIVAVFVIFLFLFREKVAMTSMVQSDPGFHTLDCLSENEVNHALTLIDLKKYQELQTFIQNNPSVKNEIRKVLGDHYVFQDYLLSIEKSAISTCHRDENGHMFNGQTHPAYTILFYLEPMDACLDVIAGSHKRKGFLNVSHPLESVPCTPGQAILFDADLIHSGSMNAKDDNKRVQMKLIHKEDVGKISQFDGYHKVADASKTNARWYTKFVRDMSCTFTGFADLTKNGQDTPVWLQKLYKTLVYGGDDKYLLTDVTPPKKALV